MTARSPAHLKAAAPALLAACEAVEALAFETAADADIVIPDSVWKMIQAALTTAAGG